MFKSVFRSCFFLSALILGLLAISALIIRNKLLDPDYYKDSLNEAQVYSLTSSLIEHAQENNFKNFDTNKSKSPEINDSTEGTVEEITFKILGEILDNIDIEELIKITVEANIDNVFYWARGERTELLIFFPREEIISSVSNKKIQTILLDSFTELLDFDNLPDCEPLDPTTEIDVSNIICIDEKLILDIERLILETMPESDKSFVEEILDESVPYLDEETPLSDLNPELSEMEIKDTLNNVKKVIDSTFQLPLLVLIISLLLITCAALLSDGIRLFIVLKMYLIIGIVLIIAGVIFNVFFTSFFIGSNFFQEIIKTDDLFSAEQIKSIVKTIENLVKALISKLSWDFILLGGGLVLLSLILVVSLNVYFIKKHQKVKKNT